MQKIKKLIAVFLCCSIITIAVPQHKAEASGIPVFDGANIGQMIVDLLKQIEQLEQAIILYEQFMEYYKLYEEAREEWEEIIDQGAAEAMMKELGMEIFREQSSKQLEEMGIPPEEIFGAEATEARRMYEKTGTFIHDNIKKTHDLHESISERQDKIAALSERLKTRQTEKEYMQFQSELMLQQLGMQNEQQLLQVLKMEMDMGMRALEFEEAASMTRKPERLR